MRLEQISVTNLFNRFNHTIQMHSDSRITIIHGSNGIGKTVLLRMVDGLFNGDLSIFFSVPFREFRVDFTDGGAVEVIRAKRAGSGLVLKYWSRDADEPIEGKVGADAGLRFLLRSNWSNKPELSRRQRELLQEILRFPTQTKSNRSTAGFWAETFARLAGEGNDLSRDALQARLLEAFEASREPLERGMEWLGDLRRSFPVKLIDTQRLLGRAPEAAGTDRNESAAVAAEAFSKDLADTIQHRLAKSSELSQSLDRSFPSRVISETTRPTATYEQLRSKLTQLEDKRMRLMEVGLMDKDQGAAFSIPERIQDRNRLGTLTHVLQVYVQDMEKKLSEFDDLASRIALFMQIINSRFLYKQVLISRERGFYFETDNGDKLSARDLSSGEQHEVVLLYDLLFKVQHESLILIDEPELSLHIAWQRQVLKDLDDVTRLVGLDILIATHSPDIIHDRWDITVGLDGSEGR